MSSRAPGKLMLSGAYSVLRGAPAVVTAVQRYAVADGKTPAQLITPEVRTAVEQLLEAGHTDTLPEVPWFDASPLREGGRKLGLGSSAAILVASLWEVILTLPEFAGRSSLDLREIIFEKALVAHRVAQGGGSGVDVAASTFGGTMVVKRAREELYLEATPLPEGLSIEVYAMPEEASTSEYLARVMALSDTDPTTFDATFGAQVAASHQAADALRKEDAMGFLNGLRAQNEALIELGKHAGLPIVLPSVQQLHRSLPSDACFLPSGAGGGDVSLYVGLDRSSTQFREQAVALGMHRLTLGLDAAGSGPLVD